MRTGPEHADISWLYFGPGWNLSESDVPSYMVMLLPVPLVQFLSLSGVSNPVCPFSFPLHHLPSPPPSSSGQAQLIQMVVWMLQRRLLIQLHTYVCLLVPPSEEEPGLLRDEELPLVARVGGRSLSTPSALSFGSPSM